MTFCASSFFRSTECQIWFPFDQRQPDLLLPAEGDFGGRDAPLVPLSFERDPALLLAAFRDAPDLARVYSLALCISESREQESRITLEGERDQRRITASEIAFRREEEDLAGADRKGTRSGTRWT